MSSLGDGPACRASTTLFVPPPDPLPFPFNLLMPLAERKIGGRLEGLRALSRYPKALVGAGLLEACIAVDEKDAPRRLLALVRLKVSYEVACPFCVDLNGADFGEAGIAAEELEALRRERDPETVPTFSEAEKAAIAFAEAACATPIRVSGEAAARVVAALGERGFVIVAATAAQVNFWARLLQGLGAPPAGVASDPAALALQRYARR